MVPAISVKGNTKMNANLNSAMNDIRSLSTVELDAVSGGAVVKLFDITIGGLQIVGVGNTDTGHNTTWVQGGGVLIIKPGKQQ